MLFISIFTAEKLLQWVCSYFNKKNKIVWWIFFFLVEAGDEGRQGECAMCHIHGSMSGTEWVEGGGGNMMYMESFECHCLWFSFVN
jgi:hypothetical protein